MDERAAGIILRTRPLTETSLIVHWLTPGLGRLATVAKGARRSKSPLRGKLDLFFEAEFSFARSRRSELHTLREVSLHQTNEPLRCDLAKLQQAAYAVRLIEQTTEMESPVPELYALLAKFIAHLNAVVPQPLNIFTLEMKLLAVQGLKPDLAEAKLSAGARMILAKILSDDFPSLTRLKISEAQTRELRQFLHGFLIYHLGRLPKGREAVLTAAA